ncbi:hypothetical protein SEA_ONEIAGILLIAN_17 [Microbacterium phage OneinaGillian]|uniref:Uncharacterized protein n=1 Tax=Microbacterium phage OneinaGillian TaxID=2301604 RepID=A0A385UKI5_9CAUD|nr:hypothetical protein HOU23_gp017 [Microbacterium phage OneinaGillian]AYB70127.1 hypothetical protein SEA_ONEIAGILLIAN_17 [Microbacterium phage OneinaGillian]
MGALEDAYADQQFRERIRRDPLLREQHERNQRKIAAARRTRLHSFGLAGGRR